MSDIPIVPALPVDRYAGSIVEALAAPAAALARLAEADAARIRAVLDARNTALHDLQSSGLKPLAFVAQALQSAAGDPGDASFDHLSRVLTPVLGGDAASPAEIGRRVVGQVLHGVAGTDVVEVLERLPEVVEPVKGLVEVFDAALGHDLERPVVEAAAAWALPQVRKLKADADAGALVAAVDVGFAAVKAMYQVGTGQVGVDEVVDHVIDRAASALVAGVRVAAAEVGADVGAAVGGFLGGFVGLAPVGVAVGAAIGRVAGAKVVDTVRSVAAQVARPLLNAAVSLGGAVIKNATSVARRVFGWVFG